jgi:hypothetical protein
MAAIARDVQRLSTAMASTDGTLGDLLAMTPTEFEYFVGDLLTAHGYKNMQRVGGAGDMAADLLGHDPAGRTVIVQCKRYAPGQRIGSPVLQQFIGMMHVQHRAQAGVFVTTSGYTGQAIILAREHAITLIDGSDLVEMVHQARRSPGAGGRTVERSLNRASTKYTPIFSARTERGKIEVFSNRVEITNFDDRDVIPVRRIWGVSIEGGLFRKKQLHITTKDKHVHMHRFVDDKDAKAARDAIARIVRADAEVFRKLRTRR